MTSEAEQAPTEDPAGPGIDAAYAELTRLCERLHRRYLDIVRLTLSEAGDDAITPVQALMLAEMGDGEVELRDLLDRGYHLSSTATYNIRKLSECGYLEQTRSQRDRRMSRLKLTERGRVLRDRLNASDSMNARQFLERPGLRERVGEAVAVLRELERSYFEHMSYRRF